MHSTVIRSYHCDRRRRELDIVFQSRRRYTYLDVPEKTSDAMKAAFSKGEFFNRYNRDHFTFEHNGEEPPPGRSPGAEIEV